MARARVVRDPSERLAPADLNVHRSFPDPVSPVRSTVNPEVVLTHGCRLEYALGVNRAISEHLDCRPLIVAVVVRTVGDALVLIALLAHLLRSCGAETVLDAAAANVERAVRRERGRGRRVYKKKKEERRRRQRFKREQSRGER